MAWRIGAYEGLEIMSDLHYYASDDPENAYAEWRVLTYPPPKAYNVYQGRNLIGMPFTLFEALSLIYATGAPAIPADMLDKWTTSNAHVLGG